MRVAVAVLIAAAVVVAGAPSAPASVATVAGATHRAPERTSRCARGVPRTVKAAFSTLFGRAQGTSPDARAAVLQDGDDPALRSVLDTWLADPGGTATDLTADSVRCRGPNRAAVDTELVLSGTPMAAALPHGIAVRQDGTWKVARSTFCARLILENPALASAGACAARR